MLSAWSTHDISTAMQIATHLQHTDFAKKMADELNSREEEMARLNPVSAPQSPVTIGGDCPSCGKGTLAPVQNRDRLNIIGCGLCRYSEVIS